MNGEATPASKRTFSDASLPPSSPNLTQQHKKVNMSIDLDSLIATLTDERCQNVLTKTISSVLKIELTSALSDAIKTEFHVRDQKIEALQNEVKALKKQISSLAHEKVAENERVALELDEQEQYSRRNNLRIHFPTPEHPDEDSTELVLEHAKTLGVALTPADIDRSHRVGKKQRGPRAKPRPVVVRFTSYWRRKEFFSARKNDEIYISEDLTERRATLLYHARSLRRNGHLKFCWTRDGSVYVKIHDSVENRESPVENETYQKKTITKIMTLKDLIPFGLDPAIIET